MENVRIAILNSYDTVCAFMDNSIPGAMHYYSDELHSYLKGVANTYVFKTDARHDDSQYLVVGNKLAFRYEGKDYYMNIMSSTKDEDIVEVEAYSLFFELLNEHVNAYAAPSAMTFAKYLEIFDLERTVELGINEVDGKSIKHEWTGIETILSRLFSLATVFDAEVEFVPVLNDDYSLKKVAMNVYKEHDDEYQGVGRDRTDIILRYGTHIKKVSKTEDVKELYTAIRPYGKDGLTIAEIDKTELDADGNIEFISASGNDTIHAIQAKERFPSNLLSDVICCEL